VWFALPKAVPGERHEIKPRHRLFLMILPFLVLVTLFSYLPLWGWRVSFFDYRPGFPLTKDNFVGLDWFRYLFDNPATRARVGLVLRNTFAMSGIGIATSWLPMVFAIVLSEMRSRRGKRLVQTVTTIPNFISWVLVYSVAFAIFSTEGFLNWLLVNLGFIESGSNWLMSGSNIWLKMWAWGTWKGLGWGAIIYIASISGIDPQLYEAATVDGAGRFRRMWHVTVPGLLSTYFVLLLLGISNILSNGMDQYLVFSNPANMGTIEVLDLYVYNLGLASGSGGNIPLATLIGMLKSVISITLLLGANRASKYLRGESIV
jgi:putative aldouronate transport system permease protein